MNSKKIFLLPVIISFIGHAALISASGVIDLRSNAKSPEHFMVKIAEPQPEGEQRKEEEKPQAEHKEQKKEQTKPLPPGGREDTVEIGSSDIKYAAYLAGVKKRSCVCGATRPARIKTAKKAKWSCECPLMRTVLSPR